MTYKNKRHAWKSVDKVDRLELTALEKSPVCRLCRRIYKDDPVIGSPGKALTAGNSSRPVGLFASAPKGVM